MSLEQVTTGLKKINEFEINDENSLLEELLKKLMKYERTRSLYDGSSLSNHGHLLMMVACLYDPAVFLTDLSNEKEAGKGADHRESLKFVCKCSMNTLPDHFSTTIFFYQCWKWKKFYVLLIKIETGSLYCVFILEHLFFQ